MSLVVDRQAIAVAYGLRARRGHARARREDADQVERVGSGQTHDVTVALELAGSAQRVDRTRQCELLAGKAGVFAEPSGAAGLAGLLTAREKGWLRDGEKVAVLVTGHGLKDPGAGLSQVSLPAAVPPLPAD